MVSAKFLFEEKDLGSQLSILSDLRAFPDIPFMTSGNSPSAGVGSRAREWFLEVYGGSHSLWEWYGLGLRTYGHAINRAFSKK